MNGGLKKMTQRTFSELVGKDITQLQLLQGGRLLIGGGSINAVVVEQQSQLPQGAL